MRNEFIFGAIALFLLGLWIMSENMNKDSREAEIDYENREVAIFAGGCFWCMEAAFESIEGVAEAISGYTGGIVENPTYEQVSSGLTEHLEAVQVYYDPEMVSYEELLDMFWRNIDPTDNIGQFADKGPQYRTAIFYHNEEQRSIAERTKRELNSSGIFNKPIVTEIRLYTTFYRAEEYHQNYYMKHVLRYNAYKKLSGRQDFIDEFWENK